MTMFSAQAIQQLHKEFAKCWLLKHITDKHFNVFLSIEPFFLITEKKHAKPYDSIRFFEHSISFMKPIIN